jgi:hypothetical protein
MGDGRPVLTFDLDGVLCRPPFGINPGRGIGKRREGEGTKSLLWRTERWRYSFRRPMAGAAEGLQMLSTRFDCKVVSARSADAEELTRKWCERYLGVAPELYLRPDWREKPAQFKVRKIVELGALAHFEDDAHTAGWVAESIPAVFLVDWWRNRWFERENVHRIHRLADALPALAALTGQADSA